VSIPRTRDRPARRETNPIDPYESPGTDKAVTWIPTDGSRDPRNSVRSSHPRWDKHVNWHSALRLPVQAAFEPGDQAAGGSTAGPVVRGSKRMRRASSSPGCESPHDWGDRRLRSRDASSCNRRRWRGVDSARDNFPSEGPQPATAREIVQPPHHSYRQRRQFHWT